MLPPPPPERLPSHNLWLADLPRAYKGSEISGWGEGGVSDKKSMEEEKKLLIKSGPVNGEEKKKP